jgi:hypothetical protein
MRTASGLAAPASPLALALAILAGAGVGCTDVERALGSREPSLQAASDPSVDCGAAACRTLPFVRTISSAVVFDALAVADHQLGAFGQTVKFFVDARDAAQPATYFMNGNYRSGADAAPPESALLHYRFAQAYLNIPEAPADYNQVTYFTNDKRYFAGTVQRYELAGEARPIYGVQFFPQDVISGEAVVAALRLIAASFHAPDAAMAFVTTGEQQDVASVVDEIAALGFRTLSTADVLGTLDYLPLNTGEAWGHLRVFPESQDDLRPTDIAVLDALPLDLAVVAGVITRAYQDPSSHVNLKSRERGTPNMMLRSVGPDAAALAGLADQPVHLVVREDGYTIEAASEAEVQARLAERLARPWTALALGGDERLLAYDEMCPSEPADCLTLKASYGAKAANLGFLANRYVLGRAEDVGTLSAQLGYDVSPRGFGVPSSWYRRFVGAPENAVLRAKIAALVAAEKAGDVSPAERRKKAQAVRAAFLAGTLPAGMESGLRERLAAWLPDAKRVKVRSSANAEDVTGFNGAGLYDSFKARPAASDTAPCAVVQKMTKHGAVRSKLAPDTLACAVKATWASLWNERAIAERSFARLDHATAAMGLAVVAAYDLGAKIDANSVVVTRAPQSDAVAAYSLSTYEKNNLVTNPAPSTWSELMLAVLLTDDVPTSLTLLRHGKSKVDAAERADAIMAREQTLTMVEVAKAVELAWCHADDGYYPPAARGERGCEWTLWDEAKPRALDLEFKLRADGRFVCKQVRPFAGAR